MFNCQQSRFSLIITRALRNRNSSVSDRVLGGVSAREERRIGEASKLTTGMFLRSLARKK